MKIRIWRHTILKFDLLIWRTERRQTSFQRAPLASSFAKCLQGLFLGLLRISKAVGLFIAKLQEELFNSFTMFCDCLHICYLSFTKGSLLHIHIQLCLVILNYSICILLNWCKNKSGHQQMFFTLNDMMCQSKNVCPLALSEKISVIKTLVSKPLLSGLPVSMLIWYCTWIF